MRRKKKIGWIVLGVFVLMQLIRPARNVQAQKSATDITSSYAVPANVQFVLSKACYDCHSNNTRYPWYADVQPAGWFLAWHVRNGKQHLNFSEFGAYTKRQQRSKFKEIASTMKDGSMPLSSYKWLHKDANLSEEEKKTLLDWTVRMKDSL